MNITNYMEIYSVAKDIDKYIRYEKNASDDSLMLLGVYDHQKVCINIACKNDFDKAYSIFIQDENEPSLIVETIEGVKQTISDILQGNIVEICVWDFNKTHKIHTMIYNPLTIEHFTPKILRRLVHEDMKRDINNPLLQACGFNSDMMEKLTLFQECSKCVISSWGWLKKDRFDMVI